MNEVERQTPFLLSEKPYLSRRQSKPGEVSMMPSPYVGILDDFDFSKDRASKRGRNFGAKNSEAEAERENRGSDDDQEAEDDGGKSGIESEVEYDEQ